MSDQQQPAEPNSNKSAPVTRRPVQEEDEPFLLKVYASTRADELALTPWDEAQREAFLKMQFTAQQMHYRNYYPGATHEIILLKDQPVGRLYVVEEDENFQILDITILPEHRSAGTGTPILKDIQAKAAKAGKSVGIYVESFNPSLRLFERLGFSKVEENGIHFLMVWRPGA
jgi:ribosomal protein S18 acetylase RimI-like enzyme